jgi:acetoin utilization deacetylase AcuC-like enzyme
MEKFPLAFELLQKSPEVAGRLDIISVNPCRKEILQLVHSREYLDKIRHGRLEDAEKRRLGLPDGEALYFRSAREVEGTRMACITAMEEGISWNLAGGTHHAFPEHGEGFCVLNDVAVAVLWLRQCLPKLRVLVVDTDAHQGNGTHAIFARDNTVYCYSVHVGANYPSRKIPGDFEVPLPRFASDLQILQALRETLPLALSRSNPDLVIWISGADPHWNDRFGQMQMTVAGMLERDRYVSGEVLRGGIPLTVLYGGGYNRNVLHTAKLHRNSVLASIRSARPLFQSKVIG